MGLFIANEPWCVFRVPSCTTAWKSFFGKFVLPLQHYSKLGNKRIFLSPGHSFYSEFVVVSHNDHFPKEIWKSKGVRRA